MLFETKTTEAIEHSPILIDWNEENDVLFSIDKRRKEDRRRRTSSYLPGDPGTFHHSECDTGIIDVNCLLSVGALQDSKRVLINIIQY